MSDLLANGNRTTDQAEILQFLNRAVQLSDNILVRFEIFPLHITIEDFRTTKNDKTLPTRAITDQDLTSKLTCTICLQRFATSEIACQLPCQVCTVHNTNFTILILSFNEVINYSIEFYFQHEFHSQCIESWLENKSSCPLCRANVN